MTGFTPGPWAIQNLGADDEIVAGEDYLIVIVTGQNYGQYRNAPDNGDAEFAANAHLIAAAPDMFNALKAALAILMAADDNLPAIKERRELVRAAIAKAKGETK